MGIFETAKSMAESASSRRAAERDALVKARVENERIVELMRAEIVSLLSDLDGKPALGGHAAFKVEFRSDLDGAFAFITVDGDYVAWFKARVVSGTMDYGEGCVDDYSSPTAWARIYGPNARFKREHDGTWDLQELKLYFNGGSQETCIKQAEVAQFVGRCAGHIAAWI